MSLTMNIALPEFSEISNSKLTIHSRGQSLPRPKGMEFFISAVIGELASRSMSLFINKYSKQPVKAMEDSLERILLRAQVIIDEAAGRHITNQGMLQQLSMLRDAMYRGCFVLDAFRYRAIEEEGARDHQVGTHSWALSKFSNAKRLCLWSSSTKALQALEEVLVGLRTMIRDDTEMVMFLTTYPRMHSQPYSMHLLLEKSMFARQMEMELVINFLLHSQSCSSSLDRFDVLPIVGPGRAGKSTLVAHACDDEIVRGHFSQILFFRQGNLRDEDIAVLRDESATKPKNNGKVLVVVEVVGELDKDLWERLCSLSKKRTTSGSKIIITSRSDKIKKLGTTQTLALKHLSHEAYWYFFKVLTFGSTDPKMHPGLTYLAMEIATLLNGSLNAANVTARLLRDNFSFDFWFKVLTFLRGCVERHVSMFGEHPRDLLDEGKPTYLRRLGRTSEYLIISDQYQTCSFQEEVPQIKLQDVMFGGMKPNGTFKTLAWKSRILPYYCYICTCEIRELQTSVVKRKRSD